MAETTPADNKNLPLGHELASEQLEAFAHNEGLAVLAELFGEDTLPQATSERLAVLQTVTEKYAWDKRKGAERQTVEWKDELLEQEGVSDFIFAAADKLGMVESSRPKNRHPDYLVVLGGAQGPLRSPAICAWYGARRRRQLDN